MTINSSPKTGVSCKCCSSDINSFESSSALGHAVLTLSILAVRFWLGRMTLRDATSVAGGSSHFDDCCSLSCFDPPPPFCVVITRV